MTHNLTDFVEKKYDRAGKIIDKKPGERPKNERIITPQEYIEHLNLIQGWVPTFKMTAEILNDNFNKMMQELLASGKYKKTKDILCFNTSGNNFSFIPTKITSSSKQNSFDTSELRCSNKKLYEETIDERIVRLRAKEPRLLEKKSEKDKIDKEKNEKKSNPNKW